MLRPPRPLDPRSTGRGRPGGGRGGARAEGKGARCRLRCRGRLPLLLPVLLAGLWAPAPGAGQEIDFVPRTDRAEERRLGRFLEEKSFTVWSRDTVTVPGQRTEGNLLVLGASVRLASEITGDIYVVAGDLFLRPDARIGGDVVVLGGGYYASSLAAVEGEVAYEPNALLRVERGDGVWRIRHIEERQEKPVELDGLHGLHAPLYNRVDEWTFGWGALFRGLTLPWQPSLELDLRVHTEGAQLGEGTMRQYWHPTAGLRLGWELERRTRSRDEWIRRDLINSVAFFFGAEDMRNHYRSERASLRVESSRATGWIPSLGVSWEEARSLEARSVTRVFEADDDVRPNPLVDDGKIWSVDASLRYRRRSPTSRFSTTFLLEGSDEDVAGDFSFLLGEARLTWERPGWLDHRVEVRGITRYDLAGTLPGQRESALGGSGTLPTLDALELQGPRLAFLEATYLVPVRPLELPVLGAPSLFLRNAAGSVWEEEGAFTVEDNVVVGVRYLFLELGVGFDVTEDRDPEFEVGGFLPTRLLE